MSEIQRSSAEIGPPVPGQGPAGSLWQAFMAQELAHLIGFIEYIKRACPGPQARRGLAVCLQGQMPARLIGFTEIDQTGLCPGPQVMLGPSVWPASLPT